MSRSAVRVRGRSPALSAAGLARRLAEPWLWWLLAAVFAVRDLVLAIGADSRPDALALHVAAVRYLLHPGELYVESAQALARTGTLPVPGHSFLYPPVAAWLGIPFFWLPDREAVLAWTLTDAVALVAALLILYRLVRPSGLARPVFWLVAAYFPPLFAEVDAGQLGGVLLLLTAGASWALVRKPVLAGALVGFAAAVKYYPAAWLLGVWRWRPWAAAALTGVMALALGFARLGPQSVSYYVGSVLLPSFHSSYADCAIVSVHTFSARLFAGETYYVPSSPGIQAVSTGLHLPWLAQPATYLIDAAVVLALLWATRRSRAHPLYAPLLALSLGALLPGEVNPYQVLPLLPVTVLTVTRALERGRAGLLAAAVVGLLLFVRQPCYSPFPNLWTVGALVLFATAVAAVDLFAEPAENSSGRGTRSVEQRR